MSSLGKPVIQIGTGEELEEKEKPRYANLRQGKNLETVSLAEALESFQLPRTLGEYQGQEMVVNTGRYGPYVKYGEQFISLAKGQDPFELTADEAIQLVLAKLEADKPVGFFEGQPITKGKGRFGPFIKWADLYVNVPKAYNFDFLTEEQALTLLAGKIEKEANRYIQHWPELKISIENGRWGPYIKFGKSMLNLPKIDGAKMNADHARSLSLEDVKAIIEKEIPGAFDVKAKPAKKAGAKTAKEKAPAKAKAATKPKAAAKKK
jgi:DNA topoisomerase-1